MIIFDIRNITKQPLSDAEHKILSLLEGHNVHVHHINPSLLSSLLSMRIASKAKKHSPDAIITHNTTQLIAAASAKKIMGGNNRCNVALIYRPNPHHGTPRGITAQMSLEVSAAVYNNNEQKQIFKEIFHSPSRKQHNGFAEYVLSTPAMPHEQARSPEATPMPEQDIPQTLTLLWAHDINNHQRLDTLIDAVAMLPQHHARIKIKIQGQGKARYIMPIVRKTRNISTLNIEWPQGQGTFTHPEAIETDTTSTPAPQTMSPVANIATDTNPTPLQATEMSAGVPLLPSVDAAHTAAIINSWLTEKDSFRQACRQAQNQYKNAHSPCFHVEQWCNILQQCINQQQSPTSL